LTRHRERPDDRSAERSKGSGARRSILLAAQALLAEGGHEQLSIRRLSERCGYTAPTIYHHFGDKGGLLDMVLEESFGSLLKRLRRVRRQGDPVETLRQLLRALVRFGQQNPGHYQLLASRPAGGREPLQAMDDAYEIIEAPLLELHERGRLKGEDPEPIIQSFWALAHGIITLEASRPDLDWSRKRIEIAIDAILYGVVATPSAKGREPRA
jgi:AcrR family transcriptional regulator